MKLANEISPELSRKDNVDWNDDASDLTNLKGYAINETLSRGIYEKYQEFNTEDLYFESGGFEGLLEKNK